MNIRQISIIGGAMLVAGGAFIWMRSQSANPQVAQPIAATEVKAETVNVLVAKRDMVVGERISPSSLGWEAYTPTSASTPGFFLQSKNPKAIEEFSNGIVRQAMVKGEPVLASKIVDVEATTGAMAALLTPGMRAVSFPISPETAVAGFVLPNDRVDILLTREVQFSSNGQSASRVISSAILENVRILAIDQAITQDKDKTTLPGGIATVELSAADAEKLRLAHKLGDLSVTLRGYADAGEAAFASPTRDVMNQGSIQMSGDPKPPSPSPNVQQASQAIPMTVKVYRGGQ
ncbi:Flp pilus assembly protein CpaB [Aquidulcibacter sp.]|uniref:Flp pilus assembly protein CpaB n=1 Tax=Aquidulcibacter sp. TaxID=2052990 RepID=UPI0025C19091|nr:Flp pilus assembly protein CpaB [Aquidulcibacter sp.]MCA3695978.1 Flp pilus assembly protein CpaB [Aquidulcibacter sp.]